jgi:hypothetical protein
MSRVHRDLAERGFVVAKLASFRVIKATTGGLDGNQSFGSIFQKHWFA